MYLQFVLCIYNNWIFLGSIRKPEDFDNYVIKDGARVFICMVCSLVLQSAQGARIHVETKHFPNTLTYKCLSCEKSFGTHSSFSWHKRTNHRN